MKSTALVALLMLSGCGGDPPDQSLPACDTLTAVWFVSRCDASHARCALKSTAPAGSVPSGCELTIVAVPGGPEQVECVESCE